MRAAKEGGIMTLRGNTAVWLCVLCFLAASFLCGTTTTSAATLRVGAAPWGSFSTIQQALSAANPGDELWVKAGVYLLTAPIAVDKAVSIYGGFVGTETSLAERDWRMHPTIIDGAQTVRCQYVTAAARIDGFTIRNGKDAAQYSDGGGIYIEAASPTIANCTITGNSATWRGGGVFNNNASPTISNCVFSNNQSGGEGGALVNQGTSAPVITGCVFADNSALYTGGAIYNSYDSASTIRSCQFLRNKTANLDMDVANSSGGAIYNDASCSAQIIDCTFSENWANVYGGAIYNNNWGATAPTNITRCRFVRNSTPFVGGAIFNAHARGKVTNSTFIENSAAQAGALENYTTSEMEIVSCTFLRNAVTSGAAIVNSDSTVTLSNSIVWGSAAAIRNSYSTCTVSYSNIQGSGGSSSWDSAFGTDGGGNIDSDPLFRSELDVHLLPTSPCVNAGNPAAALNDVDGTRNDMGAYGGPGGEAATPPAPPTGLRQK
jgi:hypothetical protein